MYLRLLDIDEFVKVNHLKEVTDPIYLDHKTPTPNGLFSHEIFGITQYDRSTIWAYIDLGGKYIHPLAAINMIRYSKIFESIIYGLKKYRFVDGEFILDNDGETGIDFLYEHYNDIKWRETKSITSNERIDFLRQDRDKLFITKFPVCPPFYRDINDNANIGIPVVNEMYKKIISQAIISKRRGMLSLFGNLTKANIQRLLVDVFNHWLDQIRGKTGLMRKAVMGRNVDYGVWLVLSSPVITGERYTDMPIDFDHFGYPLAAVLSMFKPFIFQETKNFFDNEFNRSGKYVVTLKDGTQIAVDFIDPMSEFSDTYINKKIAEFINGHSTRFEPIKIPRNRQDVDAYMVISGKFGASEEISQRAATWTDVFYRIAVRVAENKHCIHSRYPIEHFYSVCYPKIRVMSTIETIHATIDEVEYKWYPKVIPGADSSNAFINTLSPCNVYLAAEGADFDGDSTPNRALFTVEANRDADIFSRDKKNFLDLQGKNIRKTERDFVQLIYSLTKPCKSVQLEDPN